jgi:hypothetical protein
MQHMKQYIDLVENMTYPRHKMRKFRSDRGGEFKGHEFENYLKSKGIVHEFSAPYVTVVTCCDDTFIFRRYMPSHMLFMFDYSF